MSNPAQDEVDRLFAQKDHHPSHPEDRLESDIENRSTHSTEPQENEDYRSDDENADNDALHPSQTDSKMAATANYHVPTTRFDANTGPKGVIADAQSFSRAKQSTFRKTLNSFANAVSSKTTSELTPSAQQSHQLSNTSSPSDSEDEEFMRQWRQTRLRELSEQSNNTAPAGRRQSPSQRTWGTVTDVDATGYLDAIEKVKADVTVIVCIYDPDSTVSAEVEDVLDTLAYKHSTVRFVKLHHDIAEMREVSVPALLAYRGGDVVATISGAGPEGLETLLRKEGVLR